MGETYKPIPNYEDRYEISKENKKIRTISREIRDKDGNLIITLESKEVKPMGESRDLKKYVILHDGKSYNKELISELYKLCWK